MNENIKTLWLEALRSGDYQQGKSVLQGDGKFCCLGVLCDLAERAGVIEGVSQPSARTDYETVRVYKDGYAGTFNQTEVLPLKVRDWAQISDASPLVSLPAMNPSLAELNDSGMSFNEIADVIEEHF